MIKYPWDFDVIGILPSDEEAYTRFDKQAAFINGQNASQFMIVPIILMPVNYPNVPFFTGYADDIEPFGFEEDYTLTKPAREDLVKDFFSDQLIIFRPIEKNGYYKMTNVRMIGKGEFFDTHTKYVPVPAFSQSVHNITQNEFIDRLLQKKPVGRIQRISTETSDTPELVFWQNTNSKGEPNLTIVGEFDGHRYPQAGYIFSYEQIRIAPFDNNWLDNTIRIEKNPTVIYVAENTFKEMSELIKKTPPVAPLPERIEIATNVEREKPPLTELQFIEKFIQITKDEGFAYDPQDLVNFHTAMKSSTLVILSGMSGTGKSQLVQLYGKALGMDNQQLSIIPVSPAWTDDADLIGHVDFAHMVYRPGDSGLVNILLNARDDSERLFIVCYDEMNLARVEHYFSQFISVLEMEQSKRILKLYNDEVQSRLYNGVDFPSSIPIRSNVKFIGTVNLDESTYHFSDKVLDRANVISLNVADFTQLKQLDRKKKTTTVREEITLGQYLSFLIEEDKIEMSDRELEFFTALNRCLHDGNLKLGFGPRVVRQIEIYLANLPENPWVTRDEAMDLQVVQRILTKLRGPDDQIKPIVGNYNIKTDEIIGGTIYDVLDRFSEVSAFTKSRNIVANKAKELKLYGYTI